MLMPKKTKFRKKMKGNMKGTETRGCSLEFGEFGLQALETRMGKGKGNPEYWVAVVKPGRILFEVTFDSREEAVEALTLAAQKMPIKLKVVEK